MTDDELQQRIDVLSQQQALQTEALLAALEGRWTNGADSVEAFILALNPGLDVEAKVPLYAD